MNTLDMQVITPSATYTEQRGNRTLTVIGLPNGQVKAIITEVDRNGDPRGAWSDTGSLAYIVRAVKVVMSQTVIR